MPDNKQRINENTAKIEALAERVEGITLENKAVADELETQSSLLTNLESAVDKLPEPKMDRLQWKCDNLKSLSYEFYGYKGTSLDEVLDGLDTSQVTNMGNMFATSENITSIPKLDTSSVTNMQNMFSGCRKLSEIPLLNTSNVTNMGSAFNYCWGLTTIPLLDTGKVTNMSGMFSYATGLTTIPQLDTSNVTNISSMFYNCGKLTAIPQLDTSKVTNIGNMFYDCTQLITIAQLDMIKVTSTSSMFNRCINLTNLTLKNIKVTLQIGNGTSYGTKLTDESIINTAKELWDNTNNTIASSTLKLTLSTPSKARLDAIYVKLVEATADMIANDEYITNKKPCVVCESTDEGAMTLREYILSKNWTIA